MDRVLLRQFKVHVDDMFVDLNNDLDEDSQLEFVQDALGTPEGLEILLDSLPTEDLQDLMCILYELALAA
ncbi:MAG: hypothetical protein E6Q97_18000 [Desulfurellales bacterium]|nr:MAG: hypothetical protein E6Q97_18000 [Desulfurellales bacterium]